jgi:hypothetical protein
MPEFVQKRRAMVRLAQYGVEPMLGFVMLSPQAEFHAGPETVLERLNTRDRVIPFEPAEDGPTLLLSRLEIEWVLPAPSVPADLVRPPTFHVTREERAEVRFTHGGSLTGLLQMELPEMYNRASDFLNGPDDFFPLTTEDGVYLVNKLRVRDTALFEASPLPVRSEQSA